MALSPPIPKVRLGRRGPRVSVIGVGLWQLGSRFWKGLDINVLKGICRGVITAIEYGVNLLDTAEIYGGGLSERILGLCIRNMLDYIDELVVATKVAGFRWRPEDVEKAVRRSLERLRLKRISLLQHHWPSPIYSRLCTLAVALEKLVDKGLVEYIGLSNYPPKLLTEIMYCFKRYEPISNQVKYSLVYRVAENELVHLAKEYGIGLIAWSPLAKGALAGKKNAETPAQRHDPCFKAALSDALLQKALEVIAARRGVSKAIIALAWVIHKGFIPLVGFRRPERVRDIVKAASLKLDESELELLDRVSVRYKFVDGGEYKPLQVMRYVPEVIQKAVLKLVGGT